MPFIVAKGIALSTPGEFPLRICWHLVAVKGWQHGQCWRHHKLEAWFNHIESLHTTQLQYIFILHIHKTTCQEWLGITSSHTDCSDFVEATRHHFVSIWRSNLSMVPRVHVLIYQICNMYRIILMSGSSWRDYTEAAHLHREHCWFDSVSSFALFLQWPDETNVKIYPLAW